MPWWRPAAGAQDPYRKTIWWLVVILAVLGAVTLFFVMISWAIGCGTVAGCIAKLGFDDLFSRFPFLSVCCAALLIFGAAAAIIGAAFWRAIFERRTTAGEHVRKRLPPD